MTIKKCESRHCNGSKCRSSLDVRKCARTRSFMSFSVLLCFLHGHKNRSKSSKISHKIITKKCEARSCNGKKTGAVERPAKMHQNAFIFLVPRVALFTPWMQKSLKIVQNSPQNDHKKIRRRVSQWLKPHAVA